MQRGPICLSGVACTGNDRNLLDFNDITVDKDGRTLFAYADGCTGACVASTKVSDNPHSANGVVVRQTGGRGLFASYDDVLEPATTCAHPTRKGNHCPPGRQK